MGKPVIPDGGAAGGNGNGSPSPAAAAARQESGVSHMAGSSPRNLGGHRRAHSETIGLPDDLDLGVPGAGDGDGDGNAPSKENEEELFSMFLEAEKLNASSETGSSCASAGPRPRHSHSMDASSSFNDEHLPASPAPEGTPTGEAKKAMSNAKLAELALVDPKKAKRIWANRQSAARSKERKMRYISELECKVQTLHAEAATLSTQLALLQRDTAGLSTANSELKMRLQNVEQQVLLQDALNDAMKSELQRLRMATGQTGSTVGGMMMNVVGPPPPHSFVGNHHQPMFHLQNPRHHHHHHQLQLQAQQQHYHGAAPPSLKMKRAISAPNQWVGGWLESSGN